MCLWCGQNSCATKNNHVCFLACIVCESIKLFGQSLYFLTFCLLVRLISGQLALNIKFNFSFKKHVYENKTFPRNNSTSFCESFFNGNSSVYSPPPPPPPPPPPHTHTHTHPHTPTPQYIPPSFPPPGSSGEWQHC